MSASEGYKWRRDLGTCVGSRITLGLDPEKKMSEPLSGSTLEGILVGVERQGLWLQLEGEKPEHQTPAYFLQWNAVLWMKHVGSEESTGASTPYRGLRPRD